MKRRVRTILLFFLLGAIVNVAVAWSCVIWAKPLASNSDEGPSAEQVMRERFVLCDLGAVFDGVFSHGRGWSHMFATVLEKPHDSHSALTSTVHVYQQGWPLYSLRGEHWFGDHMRRDGLRGGVVIRRHFFKVEAFLAMTPVPSGFVCNAVLYGSLLRLLLCGPFRLRRLLRRQRNRCPNCGYDLRGHGAAHTVCPECGNPVENIQR